MSVYQGQIAQGPELCLSIAVLGDSDSRCALIYSFRKHCRNSFLHVGDYEAKCKSWERGTYMYDAAQGWKGGECSGTSEQSVSETLQGSENSSTPTDHCTGCGG